MAKGETEAVLVTMEYLRTEIEVFRENHNDGWMLGHNRGLGLRY